VYKLKVLVTLLYSAFWLKTNSFEFRSIRIGKLHRISGSAWIYWEKRGGGGGITDHQMCVKVFFFLNGLNGWRLTSDRHKGRRTEGRHHNINYFTVSYFHLSPTLHVLIEKFFVNLQTEVGFWHPLGFCTPAVGLLNTYLFGGKFIKLSSCILAYQ